MPLALIEDDIPRLRKAPILGYMIAISESSPSIACHRCIQAGELTTILEQKLIARLRCAPSPHEIVVGVPLFGMEAARQISKDLALPYESVSVIPISSPSNPEHVIGAASGLNDSMYIDHDVMKNISGSYESIMGQVQSATLKSVQETVGLNQATSPKGWQAKKILLVACAHTPWPVVITSARAIRLNHPAQLTLVIPFLSSELKRLISGSVDNYVCLREFEGSQDLIQFTSTLATLNRTQVQSILK